MRGAVFRSGVDALGAQDVIYDDMFFKFTFDVHKHLTVSSDSGLIEENRFDLR